MIHTLCLPTVSSSISPKKSPFKRLPSSSSPSPNPHPPLLIRFPTSHRENLRYLKSLNIIPTTTTTTSSTTNFFSPEKIDQLLTFVNSLKSKGFSDLHIKKFAFLCPNLFSTKIGIDQVFEFLAIDLSASVDESRDLILRCPDILLSDANYCLKPTLDYLRELGLQNLNKPTTLNAHLLNTKVGKIEEKIRFLESLGYTNEEARKVCVRFPAIFGYSVENNLRPKVEYLVGEMERSVEELKAFPQYFAFSLDKRIVPRHLHLKERNVCVPLQKMLLWSDKRFYARWK